MSQMSPAQARTAQHGGNKQSSLVFLFIMLSYQIHILSIHKVCRSITAFLIGHIKPLLWFYSVIFFTVFLSSLRPAVDSAQARWGSASSDGWSARSRWEPGQPEPQSEPRATVLWPLPSASHTKKGLCPNILPPTRPFKTPHSGCDDNHNKRF